MVFFRGVGHKPDLPAVAQQQSRGVIIVNSVAFGVSLPIGNKKCDDDRSDSDEARTYCRKEAPLLPRAPQQNQRQEIWHKPPRTEIQPFDRRESEVSHPLRRGGHHVVNGVKRSSKPRGVDACDRKGHFKYPQTHEPGEEQADRQIRGEKMQRELMEMPCGNQSCACHSGNADTSPPQQQAPPLTTAAEIADFRAEHQNARHGRKRKLKTGHEKCLRVKNQDKNTGDTQTV